MDSIHAAQLQQQLRHNANEVQEFVKELGEWEDEIKQKDESLKKNKPILKQRLPPIRGQVGRESGGVPSPEKAKVVKTAEKGSKPARIASFDYKQWDKLDVDKVCEEMDYCAEDDSSRDEDMEDDDDEAAEQSRKQQAESEKEKGNAFFKEGQYEMAVECYTHGMDLDPLCHVLPANRAMALIKLERYAAAENDCTTSLALDSRYPKAYLRRGVARKKLGKLDEAGEDLRAVLKLEPSNKQAMSELSDIEKRQRTNVPRQPADDVVAKVPRQPADEKLASPYVQCVKRPPHLRSKVPLRRIEVENVEAQSAPRGAVNAEAPSVPVTSTAVPPLACELSPQMDVEAPSAPRGSVNVAASKDSSLRIVQAEPSPKDVVTMVTDTSSKNVGSEPHHMIVPGVPTSALQFQLDWKSLRRDETSLVKYFKAVEPCKYPALLQHSLETAVFSDILRLLWQYYSSCDISCFEELRWLTKVARFQVAVMFLSKKDKGFLQKIFETLAHQQDIDQSHLRSLAQLYSVEVHD